ncbi:MAG: hypothetical protein QOH43_3785 [Solirubrobacteraceae bacterium]|jgi:hypothetical protein|nr:hypothetical protein [Solirubrobacteraceae bacterium]
MSGAANGGATRRLAAVEDWSTRVETWAGNAQSPPMSHIRQERAPMPVNHTQAATDEPGAPRTATDRAVQAGERLLDASSKVGNAYADAYQEAVVNMADWRERLADAAPMDWGTPVDWGKLVNHPGAAGARPLNKPMHEAARTVARVNEQLVAASKQLGLAYVDACEQAALAACELTEQAAMASDNEWMGSAPMPSGVARDITKAYVDVARRLLA